MKSRSTSLLLLLLLMTTAVAFSACGDSVPEAQLDSRTPGTSGTPGITGSSTPPDTTGSASSVRPAVSPPPSPTPKPVLKHPDMVLDLKPGDFWDFRWEFSDQSCSQGRGCSTGTDEGVFRVTLGASRTISETAMFPVSVTGKHLADDGAVDLAPDWKFIGVADTRLLASDGFSLTTIFDALDGEWTGSGFFSRFGDRETHVARPTSIGTQSFAEWGGVRSGPAISVVRSDSESMCEVIEGRRICPRDQAFSVAETQYYREGVGPFGYNHRFSASFSGGGFFSSNATEETVALVASSFRGDVIEPTPIPVPPSPTPLPELELDVVFGPEDGALLLINIDDQIPDFETGVDLVIGVVDATFVNPDVGGGAWSYGITFRHSGEETFHAVYVTGNGQWEHFARGGSAASQVSPGSGRVTLNTGVGEENRLFVAFSLDEGAFFVNGVQVAELDLSTSNARASGDVRVMAGILNTDTYNGAVSEYYDLTVLAP